MEFADKAVNDKYSDLRARQADLEYELDEIEEEIQHIIDTEERA